MAMTHSEAKIEVPEKSVQEMQKNISSLTKTIALIAESQAKIFESQTRMEQWVFGKEATDPDHRVESERVRKVVNDGIGGQEEEGRGSCKDAKSYVDEHMRRALQRIEILGFDSVDPRVGIGEQNTILNSMELSFTIVLSWLTFTWKPCLPLVLVALLENSKYKLGAIRGGIDQALRRTEGDQSFRVIIVAETG